MANIREANNINDLASMLVMGEDMHNESPRFQAHQFNLQKSASLLKDIDYSENGILLVAEEHDTLVGMLIGIVSTLPFCDGLVANELVVYVAPEYRGSSACIKLIKRFEEWATSKGVDEIILGVSTEVEADRTHKLYERLGYTHNGTSLIKKRVSITHH